MARGARSAHGTRAVGLGVRLYIPQFGQAPLAFDFAVPVVDEETDEDRLFSFSFDLPF